MVAKKTQTAAGQNIKEAANIPPATEFDPSGAPRQIVPDVDPDHSAVDSNPRKNTTADQNRIDFNDPTLIGSEAVAKNLGYEVDEEGE